MIAWHFLYEGHKMRDGQVAPDDGVILKYDGKIQVCSNGYHASPKPHQALRYAPGPVMCLVRLGGEIIQGDDKVVAQERTILARMDATEMLMYYARMQALKATQYWEPPDVVIDYLMTGDESIRAAAWAAASAAARAAASAEAWAAASAAARAAASAAARAAASAEARAAACAAARAAASAAARAAASAAARAEAWDASSAEFDALVFECFEGPLGELK